MSIHKELIGWNVSGFGSEPFRLKTYFLFHEQMTWVGMSNIEKDLMRRLCNVSKHIKHKRLQALNTKPPQTRKALRL